MFTLTLKLPSELSDAQTHTHKHIQAASLKICQVAYLVIRDCLVDEKISIMANEAMIFGFMLTVFPLSQICRSFLAA